MEKLYGIVSRITYQNLESSYSVLKIKSKYHAELITVIGTVPCVNVGSVLHMTGEWKIDNKYGKQFVISSYEETLPASIYGIQKYLGSGLICGVGPVYAKKIVSKFGTETLNVIEKEPMRLMELDGIGQKRVKTIMKAWQEHKEIKNIMMFLQSYDISASHATKIFKQYGNKSIEVIKENPYQLAEDINGIGFKSADDLAMKLGIDKESYIRCRSGILYTLNKLSNEGHCFAYFNQLTETAVKLLDIEEAKIVMTISHIRLQNEIIKDKDRHYLAPFYFSEIGVAKLIKKIGTTPRKKEIKNRNINQKIQYDRVQSQSIRLAVLSKFIIITGGPGTGKTTTMNGIIEIFRNNHFEVILAAPTGRAAKRMTESSGLQAKTIHRLLDIKPSGGFKRNEESPLEGDVLIIDESSMIDLILMYNLLKTVPKHMSVIMIGDKDQLPSVNAGNVFSDIIESHCVPVVKLEKIYRQAVNSDIIKNAHKINNGMFPVLKTSKTSDFFFIEEEAAAIPQLIAELCTKRLPKTYRINPMKEIQVLCPMQKGDTGTIKLNSVMQSALNKNNLSVRHGGNEFRLNDRVMQIKNNYNKEVFNGDIGIICKINLEDHEIIINFDDNLIQYSITELDEIVLAYAVTIHKSQGSEYPIAIMPLTMSHIVMLQRNLIYTGITRAKKLLILVGSIEAIEYAVKNNKVTRRNTYLCERLKSSFCVEL